ncbi:PIG-L family deacetylase [Candidatus Shapirobacteria bacterium]|nr:PIG-L family deacetylase [Candidatus Shapirobacteria bacterium]
MILLTKGEKGKNPKKRVGELGVAMNSWGFDYKILNFPDLELAYVPLKKMVDKVRNIVDKNKITDLVSFSPFELTYGFDHPDHNIAGEVTRLVSTGMSGHRGLRLWKSENNLQSSDFNLLLEQRIQYVQRFYPSQKIPKEVLEKIGESYINFR